MKNKAVFFLLILIPITPFLYFFRMESQWNHWMTFYLFAYLMIYRPILDYYRLKSKGLIERKDQWKIFIPFYRIKYIKGIFA